MKSWSMTFKPLEGHTDVNFEILIWSDDFVYALLIKYWYTVLALFEPHSWIEPHPVRNHAKMQFLCILYETICGQKPVLKNRTPGFK